MPHIDVSKPPATTLVALRQLNCIGLPLIFAYNDYSFIDAFRSASTFPLWSCWRASLTEWRPWARTWLVNTFRANGSKSWVEFFFFNFQTVGANMSGEMCLRLETDEVQVTTFFKDLQNHHFQVCQSNPQDQWFVCSDFWYLAYK